MNVPEVAAVRAYSAEPTPGAVSGKSATSWSAILAGAFVAAGSSCILLALGSGIGFAIVSPWGGHGASAAGFTVTTAIWLIVTQWVSAALGGYIAGRLRVRWIGTHTHEVFFRDTAHGLVTWAVATVAIVTLVGFSAFSIIGQGLNAASGMAASAAEAGDTAVSPNRAYAVDKLFRSLGAADRPPRSGDSRAEAVRIIIHSLANGGLPEADRTYLTASVASATGASQADAQARVDEFVETARETESQTKLAADLARKAAAAASLYTSLSLLIGAFIASVSAALGGHLRDQHP